MKTRCLLLLLFFCSKLRAQEYRDTVLVVGSATCSCKYNISSEDDNVLFDRNAPKAYYPGGEEAWKKFVRKNLYTGFKGKDKVMVRFQVDRNGDLSNFTLVNRSPNQKYEEVLRLLKLSGKWFPSVQKGYCVKSYLTLEFEL